MITCLAGWMSASLAHMQSVCLSGQHLCVCVCVCVCVRVCVCVCLLTRLVYLELECVHLSVCALCGVCVCVRLCACLQDWCA